MNDQSAAMADAETDSATDVNAAQRAAWDGEDGRHWVAQAVRHDTMLERHTTHLLQAAAIKAGEAVMDIGCGCGATTLAAAQASGGGPVLGVDLSAGMLAEARVRAEAEGLSGVRFEQADAQVAEFGESVFDLVLSRFGVMFFDDPGAAFARLRRTLRPSGRLVFLCWQEVTRNDHVLVPFTAVAPWAPPAGPWVAGQPGPFSLADPERIRGLLSGAGFTDVRVESVAEPMRMGADAQDVTDYLVGTPVARSLLEAADEQTAASATAALREALRAYETPGGVQLGSAAWLVTASA